MHKYSREFLATLDPEVLAIVRSNPDIDYPMPTGYSNPFGCQESGQDMPAIQEKGTAGIIENLAYYVSDLELWRRAWDVKRYQRLSKKRSLEYLRQYIPEEYITARGTVRQRERKQ